MPRNNNVIQVNNRVFVDGVELPECPSKNKRINSAIVNGRAYMSGYEFKNGEWKRTLRALWHLFFLRRDL